MINQEAIELLFVFSVAVWALMNKTPIKALVKMLATRVHGTLYNSWLVNVDVGQFEQYAVKFCAALIALFLIGLARIIDIAIVTENMSAEWQWINNAGLVSAAGVISLIPVKLSLLYYVDIFLTVALVGVVGSAGIHRIEKWITGNSLLADAVRQWLLDRNQAVSSE